MASLLDAHAENSKTETVIQHNALPMGNRERVGRTPSLRIPWPSLLAIVVALISGCGPGAGPPTTADAIGTRRGWTVTLAEPCADTIRAPWNDVMPAVGRTFEADHWRIEKKDLRNGVIVTSWKPIQHALVRLVVGKIEARCAVTARPLDPDRTVVVFQAGIASRKSIAQNPALGLAKSASQKASQNWQKKLRADLVRHHAVSALN